jgi:DNA-binding SARP family transcriptional activator/predicted ATPase
MSHLRLALLGTPNVRHAERILKFRSRKELALLIYLAVEGGLHSREKITALLWPESDEPQGRATLRRTLADLRTTLEDTMEPSHLIVERDVLGFNATSDCELDLRLLERAYASVRTSSSLQESTGYTRLSLLSQLQHAASLYRGRFLEGFSLNEAPDFENWAGLQREVWHQRISLVLDQLSRLQAEAGEIAGAIEGASRWIALDPLNESAHRRLIELHLAAGDRHGALRAFDLFRLRLLEELHARPTAETEALLASIRSGGLGKSAAPGKPRPATSADPSLPGEVRHPGGLSGPLIGRTGEYVRLIEAYRATGSGQPQVVLLRGEAGIGKTRLAREFLAWAAEQGADVLQGHAFEASGRLPYQPLVEALRKRLERENAPDDLLSDPWLAELSRLLPEMRDRYPDLPVPTEDETTARMRLLEAVVRVGEALAERAPVVLFLDDIQWADAASLDVLHYAGRRCMEDHTPIMLLLSMRTEAPALTHELSTWLAGLERDLHVLSLTLGALTFDETLQLLRALRTTHAEGLAQWLFAQTGGQPFYAMETLKALLERGLLGWQRQEYGGWGIQYEPATFTTSQLHSFLPPGVREVIRSRLDQLTPAAFTLLVAGAVLAHNFTFERACQVAGLQEDEGLSALDEVLTRRLLQEAAGESGEQPIATSGTYFFTHDKIRDVVYTEAGKARRGIFHRRAFEGLQAASAPAGELAHHALAAGLTEQGFHFSLVAGDDALRLFAVRDAISYYKQARQVITSRPELQRKLSPEEVEQLYIQLGRAYEFIDEWEQARSVYQTLLEVGQASGMPAVEGMALNRLATLAINEGYDTERASQLMQAALQAAERSGDRLLLAEIEWNLAQLSFYRSDPVAGTAHGERALLLARALGQQELIARSLNILSYAKNALAQWEQAEACTAEGQALYKALGNRAMEVDCLCQVALVKINTGRPVEGLHAAHAALDICQESENAWGQINCTIHLAMASLELGAYADALAYAQRGVQITRDHKLPILVWMTLTMLGKVQRALFNLDAARAAHLEALALTEDTAMLMFTEMNAIELCADCALAGAWDDAYLYAVKVLNSGPGYFYVYTGHDRWYITEALVRAGERERAAEDARRFGERLGTSRRFRIVYLRSVAVLAQSRGEIDTALAHLQEAEKLAEEIGLPGELWSILAAQGELRLKQGDESKARQTFARAAEIMQTLAQQMEDTQQRAAFLSAELARYVAQQGRV